MNKITNTDKLKIEINELFKKVEDKLDELATTSKENHKKMIKQLEEVLEKIKGVEDEN